MGLGECCFTCRAWLVSSLCLPTSVTDHLRVCISPDICFYYGCDNQFTWALSNFAQVQLYSILLRCAPHTSCIRCGVSLALWHRVTVGASWHPGGLGVNAPKSKPWPMGVESRRINASSSNPAGGHFQGTFQRLLRRSSGIRCHGWGQPYCMSLRWLPPLPVSTSCPRYPFARETTCMQSLSQAIFWGNLS